MRARGIFVLALVLWTGALGRDAFDDWIDATILPPLVTEQSIEVLDRNGDLLRAYTVSDGRWRLGLGLDAVDPAYVAMLVRYEDKRFYTHAGVDPVALGRAVWQALTTGGVVSGGSTLTMQVARLLEDGTTGQWGGKLRQIRVALALERELTKDQILTLYMNRAPFGGNIEGVRAAAFAWFGKPPGRLTPAQAALLVALPQSPEARRPDRHPARAEAARDRVLARAVRDGVIDSDTGQAALREAVPKARAAFPILAPHLSDRVRMADPLARVHLTTLDAALQARVELLAADAVARHGERMQIAVVIADHQTGEILASVGSSAYVADARQGFVDMTQALRSPGSALKPLVYGIAFDRGLVHPETLIADRPTDFSGYRPQNFDGIFRGELRVRLALQQSLNIPVVSLTQAMGPGQLMAGLRRIGAGPVIPGGGTPGLAVALGGVGLPLEDLIRLYAMLGNGGTAVDVRWHVAPTPEFLPHRVIGDVAAWQVADILLGTPRPAGVRGAGIAFKTGTSYGHRDAWALGFDGAHVVGVWMGRADGTPVPGVFGGDLAAPVMFAVFSRLKAQANPIPPPPPAPLMLPTDRLPLPLQRFRPVGEATAGGPAFAFPPDGAVIEGTAITARIRDGRAPFVWLANGLPVATTRGPELALPDLGSGFSALTVIDADGRAARVRFELRP